MKGLIPCLEDLYSKSDDFIYKIQGKLPKIYSAALRNKEEDHFRIFQRVLQGRGIGENWDIARVLNKPPQYLTFFFEYQDYFNNNTCIEEESQEEKFLW